MRKIALIIAREYLSRVKRRSFVIMTILGPLLFSAVFIVPVWLATQIDGDQKIVQVIDEQNLFVGELDPSDDIVFEFINTSLEAAKKDLSENDIFGILYIPKIDIHNPEGIRFYSHQNPGISVQGSLEWKIRKKIEDIKLVNSGLDKSILENLRSYASVHTINLSVSGDEKESSTGGATAVGYIGAFLIYFFIFMYGAQIMRGVIEEKTSRIIEVVIASVRPFQLMVGKIIGVGSVGLTQFLLWVIFSTAAVFGISLIMLSDIDPYQMEQLIEHAQASPQISESQIAFQNSLDTISQFDMTKLLLCFVFYFLGGYFFYGSLFAAVGSAVDTEVDSQQFMLPITIPLILSIAMISVVIQEPHGNIAFWLSILPFSSPVIMMMRIPFDVPGWQIGFSMIMLVAGFCATTWLASRIYRIGIFMHGTKVNYKTIGKWLTMKN